MGLIQLSQSDFFNHILDSIPVFRVLC